MSILYHILSLNIVVTSITHIKTYKRGLLMLDQDGYRPNVGMILVNSENQVFWGRRKGEDSWQFPQGGVAPQESLEEDLFRELNEELGLLKSHVSIIAQTQNWLYYDVPGRYNLNGKGHYRGQKQIWFLLKFIGQDYHINLRSSDVQEFDAWCWINYWEPRELVVNFKQDVYTKALNELAPHLGMK